ncbi:MAG TPA: hypothetical protein VFV52_07280 [Bacilli bacterium]|nr:hypothetical protein [Bacilli bacterium]
MSDEQTVNDRIANANIPASLRVTDVVDPVLAGKSLYLQGDSNAMSMLSAVIAQKFIRENTADRDVLFIDCEAFLNEVGLMYSDSKTVAAAAADSITKTTNRAKTATLVVFNDLGKGYAPPRAAVPPLLLIIKHRLRNSLASVFASPRAVESLNSVFRNADAEIALIRSSVDPDAWTKKLDDAVVELATQGIFVN